MSIAGLLLLALTILSLWFSAKNFWTYARMRSVDVSVAASSLRVDATPPERGETSGWLFYYLQLDFRAEDGSGRKLHWEGEAGRAAYPEEAFDELRLWGPGTRHRIQIIRGNARELRLNEMEQPELEAGTGLLILAAMLGMIALAMLVGLGDENSPLRRFAFGRRLGIWTIFFGFGLLPLLGWGGFTASHVYRMATWQETSARRVEAGHRFDAAQLPKGVEVTPAARAILAEAKYDLIEYEWRGQRVRGGIGHFEGVHSHLGSADRLRFRISPKNRWELSEKLGWNADFWAPFGVLLFFGVAFCGAGLLIKKTGVDL